MLDGRVSLIYGKAGVGKTNLVLSLLSLISSTTGRRVIYASTEGSSYSAILGRYNFSENALFAEVYDSNSLLQLMLKVHEVYKKDLKAIAVDTVNNFYRAEVSYDPNAGRVFNTAMALLADMSVNNGVTCLLTAQVSGFDDEVRMSGFQVIKYWCDNVIKLERLDSGVRSLFVEFPKEVSLEMRCVIGDGGIEWLDCGSE